MSELDVKLDANQPASGERHLPWPMIRHQNELLRAAEMQLQGKKVHALQGKKVGEILNAVDAIDAKTLQAVERHHSIKKAHSKPIGELLVQMADELIRALYVQSGVLMVDLALVRLPRDLFSLISVDEARAKMAIPVGTFNKALYLAVGDPEHFPDKQYFAMKAQLAIKLVYASQRDIQSFLDTGLGDWTSSVWID